MLSPTECPFCGAKLSGTRAVDGRVICSQCKGAIDVAGFEPLAPLTGDSAPRPTRFPILLMLFAMPFSMVLLITGISLAMTAQWDGMAAGVTCGAGGLVATFLAMRGRWTPARAAWTLLVTLGWMGLALNLAFDRLTMLGYKPLEAEFAHFPGPGVGVATVQAQPLKPKLFPLILHERGYHTEGPVFPVVPQRVQGMWVYQKLPPALKPQNMNEVKTIVLVDWGWSQRDESNAKDAGKIYVGTCDVKVIDRKTQTVIAETKLTSPAPPKDVHVSSDWYGPQPTDEDVVAYVRTLAVTAEAEGR